MNGYVTALAVSGDEVYAGGAFSTAGGSPATNIAKWDGSSWAAPAPGMHIYPHALALTGSNLYVGGETTIAGSPAATSIARWDGSAWSTLGSGVGSPTGYYPTLYALTVSGTNLYAGGDLTTAGGGAANYIAKGTEAIGQRWFQALTVW